MMTSSRIESFAEAILASLKAKSRVLEIGSGKGELANLLRERGHYVVAVDPKAEPGPDTVSAEFEQFDAPSGYFDAAVMQLVLHHISDLDDSLDRVLRTLRRDGIVAIDDYGWERAGEDVDPQWRAERADLHTSIAMLKALRKRFVQKHYRSHAYFDDGAGHDKIGFTFIGTPAQEWPLFLGPREKRKVVLAEHNSEWRIRFEMERRKIVVALGARVRQIDHIGSTAVPGLAAKPIVDILLAVEDPLDDEVRDALMRAGYEHRVEEPDHRMFRTPQRDVHVHVWQVGAAEIDRHLTFRDRLRSDSNARITYERVKRELAKRDWADVNDYAEAKTAVIRQILGRTG